MNSFQIVTLTGLMPLLVLVLSPGEAYPAPGAGRAPRGAGPVTGGPATDLRHASRHGACPGRYRDRRRRGMREVGMAVRVGVIGTGLMGGIHARAAQDADGAELAAVGGGRRAAELGA